MAAQAPFPYRYAGYGSEWAVELYIKIVPSGRNFLVSSYQFFIANEFALSQLSNEPSILNFFPNMELIAIGSL